eukprot:CAMPEP_0174379246 /NCGR_PEP_ID=MMETSP0811_2-20130205/122586_1 /TAXON_ID=73025 ORGANISM="Eutreptiella gymnastica-like, Strain CCMP1594" /NCGR_SAMPLE_ID=MMETSP0811_2 /ASSEMBLY_ACC=CAM_ASM_000667 /LENGTH=59 /DNA_ID=CAMNT_0015531725 /DNA_START=1505 /DNA_END=1681 /DNA_ORIENTATION=+
MTVLGSVHMGDKCRPGAKMLGSGDTDPPLVVGNAPGLCRSKSTRSEQVMIAQGGGRYNY